MRDRSIVVNNKKVAVDEEAEFIYDELEAIYHKRAADAGLEWDDEYEEFIYTLSQDILRKVDNFRADLITSYETDDSSPWDS